MPKMKLLFFFYNIIETRIYLFEYILISRKTLLRRIQHLHGIYIKIINKIVLGHLNLEEKT